MTGSSISGFRNRAFERFAWAVVAYNVGVILWGAFVRATGSGAGCGSHWPLCNGEVVPRAPRVETIIEFVHRLTSGVSLLAIAALAIWAFRAFPKKHAVRAGAIASVFFIITEALVGAGLVLLQYVDKNASVARTFWQAGHLLNTMLLLAALTLTAWFAAHPRPLRLERSAETWLLAAGTASVLLTGMSGAIAALGDTIFPAQSLWSGVAQDFNPAAHFLIRLRVLHPFLAVATAGYLVVAAGISSTRRVDVRATARALIVLLVVQTGFGMINMLLLAPTWMQLVHLLITDLIWIALVIALAGVSIPKAVPLHSAAAN